MPAPIREEALVEGPEILERLAAALNSGDLSAMSAMFHDDAVMEWPQSGERIVGAANRRAVYADFPALPTVTPIRSVGDGDVWVGEAITDYGEAGRFSTVFIFELREGLIAKATTYWSVPFEAPQWRSAWVERFDFDPGR